MISTHEHASGSNHEHQTPALSRKAPLPHVVVASGSMLFEKWSFRNPPVWSSGPNPPYSTHFQADSQPRFQSSGGPYRGQSSTFVSITPLSHVVIQKWSFPRIPQCSRTRMPLNRWPGHSKLRYEDAENPQCPSHCMCFGCSGKFGIGLGVRAGAIRASQDFSRGCRRPEKPAKS